jgi:CRP-like cAMP-binding protein
MKKVFCQFCTLKSAAEKTLNSDQICDLENNCAEAHFGEGDTIVKQDSFSTNVVYIKSGLVKIHVQNPFREKIMRIVKAPAYLCLPSTFGDKINHFSATALEETDVCFIDITLFKQFIYNNGDFAWQIILDLSKSELRNLHSCINNAQKQNLGRVAEAILFFANDIYSSHNFRLPVSRQELADLTGVSRESASRILTELHNEKILEIKGRKINILKEKLLQDISDKG